MIISHSAWVRSTIRILYFRGFLLFLLKVYLRHCNNRANNRKYIYTSIYVHADSSERCWSAPARVNQCVCWFEKQWSAYSIQTLNNGVARFMSLGSENKFSPLLLFPSRILSHPPVYSTLFSSAISIPSRSTIFMHWPTEVPFFHFRRPLLETEGKKWKMGLTIYKHTINNHNIMTSTERQIGYISDLNASNPVWLVMSKLCNSGL